jgi:hypothetical protein
MLGFQHEQAVVSALRPSASIMSTFPFLEIEPRLAGSSPLALSEDANLRIKGSGASSA